MAFEVTPPRVGRYVYEISTPVADDEAVATNNARSFVRARHPRQDPRAAGRRRSRRGTCARCARCCETNPNVDLISFFILRTQDDISAGAASDEMSLIPFPTRELFEEQLPSFDLIVLQNFEYAPYGIGDYLENIRAYVEGGGGLAMLGGDRSVLVGRLPGHAGRAPRCRSSCSIRSARRSWSTPASSARRSPRPARRTRSPRCATRSPTTSRAWKALPELEGVNLVAGAKPDATVLAVHPRLTTRDGKPMPVIAVGEYGQGRTLAVITDTLWRWGFVAAGAARRRRPPLHEVLGERDPLADPGSRAAEPARRHRRGRVRAGHAGARRGAPARPRLPAAAPAARSTLHRRRGADPATAQQVGTAEVTTGDDGTGSHDLHGAARPASTGSRRPADGRRQEGHRRATSSWSATRRPSSIAPAGDPRTAAGDRRGTGGRTLGAGRRPAVRSRARSAARGARRSPRRRRAVEPSWPARPRARCLLGREWLLAPAQRLPVKREAPCRLAVDSLVTDLMFKAHGRPRAADSCSTRWAGPRSPT